MSNRYGDYIGTYSGGAFWPLDPRPEDICINDIAHALSNICRFNGHAKHFYSVAQHSIEVMRFLREAGYNEQIQLYGLLHDASEAYICDVVSPLKKYLGDYCTYEDKIMQAVWEAISIRPPNGVELDIVKVADLEMLKVEASVLVEGAEKWGPEFNRKPTISEILTVSHQPPQHVKRKFISLFNQLVKTLAG